jgi:hypothetical protein
MGAFGPAGRPGPLSSLKELERLTDLYILRYSSAFRPCLEVTDAVSGMEIFSVDITKNGVSRRDHFVTGETELITSNGLQCWT